MRNWSRNVRQMRKYLQIENHIFLPWKNKKVLSQHQKSKSKKLKTQDRGIGRKNWEEFISLILTTDQFDKKDLFLSWSSLMSTNDLQFKHYYKSTIFMHYPKINGITTRRSNWSAQSKLTSLSARSSNRFNCIFCWM